MMDRLPRMTAHKGMLAALVLVGVGAAGLATPAHATTVLIVGHDSCCAMLNARLPEDMLMLADFDRNSHNWVTPGSDPGAMAWLAGAMGLPLDDGNQAQPLRDSDVVSAFYACLAGMPNALFASSDFNHDGDVGTDADIQAFWAAMGQGSVGEGAGGGNESVPLSPAAALALPGLLAMGLRRRR
jgi:hypothetical protein